MPRAKARNCRFRKMNLVREWTGSFPELQRAAIVEAINAASLAKVRRALALVEELDGEHRGPLFRIELLSTFNVEPIAPVLRLALSCLPSRPSLRLAPLDAIEASLSQPPDVDPEASLHARVVLWRVEELLPEALYPFSNGFPEDVTARLGQVMERIDRVINLHQRNAPGLPLFVATVSLPLHFSNSLFAAQHRAGVLSLVARVNEKIYGLATEHEGVHIFDIAAWAAWEGRVQADAALDFLARQPFSARGQISFALWLARSLRPLLAPSRKALAVDLDDTVWGGVVGEDGVENLRLSHEFPGNVHLRIQRELLELKKRGIVLVLLSKNNEADARQAFDQLPEMLLQWDDFAVHKVNWQSKHENLSAVARELGLGLDSFAFLDDSDYEREQMRQMLPEVLILNDNSDPLHCLQALWQTAAFDSLVIAEEDRLRHQDYAVRKARDAGAHEDHLESFLKSLEMEATIEPVGPQNIERIVTMLGKTNQFNLTTRRHSRVKVQKILETTGSISLALRLRDKFGEQGIVALIIAVPAADPGTLMIDTFLVSCRALGRGVEQALWSALLERAHAQEVQILEAEYLATPKNDLVADLYEKLGMRQVSGNILARRYELQRFSVSPFPSWIVIASHKNVA